MSKVQLVPVSILVVFCDHETDHEKTVHLWVNEAGIPIMSTGKDGRRWPSFLVGVLKHAYSAKRKDFTIGCEVEFEVDQDLVIRFKGNRKDLIGVCVAADKDQNDVEPNIIGFTREVAKAAAAKGASARVPSEDNTKFHQLMNFVKSHEVPDLKEPEKMVVLDGRSWKSLENLRTSLNRVVSVAMASDLEGTKQFLASLDGYGAEDFFADIEADKKGILGVEPEVTKALEKNFF